MVTVNGTTVAAGTLGVVAVNWPSEFSVNCATVVPNLTDCVLVNPAPVMTTGLGTL